MLTERTNIRSMLGLRFRDAATEQPVTDGLRVTVQRRDGKGSVTRAFRTASGAYAAQGLPGLRGYERSEASGPDDPMPFLVSVNDARERYVPVLLSADLPYDPDPEKGGLYPIAEMRSEGGNEPVEPTCYLFSAVGRPVPPGQAVVYADLVSGSDLTPAAHALMVVRCLPKTNGNGANGTTWYGLADADGRVAVQFPLPPIQLETLKEPSGTGNGNGNPGGNGNGGQGNGPGNNANGNDGSTGNGQPLAARTWTLEISVRYQPGDREVPDRAERPLLPSIANQNEGTLYPDSATEQSTLEESLSYGEPLVLTTDGLPTGQSVLRIASG